MSVEAITWALRQPVPASSAKFVLVVLANCASADTGLAYPSIAYISESTGQDRKTVVANLKRLAEWGLIDDTGERSGRTKQVVVYRLNCGPSLFESSPKTEPFGTGKRSPKTEQSQKRNSSVSSSKEYRFSLETVPKTGHGTVRNRQEPVSLSPACAGEAESPEVVVTDGNGNPIVSVIAVLTPEQSSHLVKTCRALHKMGSCSFNVGDEKLAALFRDRFTAEQVVRCAGEKALRDAGLWNDPDLSPDLIDLLINGGTQRDMGLTDKQHVALRSAVSQVSIGYVAAALRGRRRDATTPTGTTHANQAIQRSPGGRGNSLAERVKANALNADRRGRSPDGSTAATRDI